MEKTEWIDCPNCGSQAWKPGYHPLICRRCGAKEPDMGIIAVPGKAWCSHPFSASCRNCDAEGCQCFGIDYRYNTLEEDN